MRALRQKAHYYKVENYEQLNVAVEQMEWFMKRINQFALMISSSHLNWHNSKVDEARKAQFAIDSEGLKSKASELRLSVHGFANDNYKAEVG